jgi:hypothetical protein
VDVPDLSRLRAGPDDDALTRDEHAAVVDAAELLDALRAARYGFALARDGTMSITPPAGARPDEGVRPRIAALAPALGYVLRLERRADSLPAVCEQCGAPVERFTPGGAAVCRIHLLAPHLSRDAVEEAMAELADEARRRDRGERLPQSPDRCRVPAPIAGDAPPAPGPGAPVIPEG